MNRRIAALTTAALVAFAANSVLTRLALAPGAIDPASFTLLRLAAGATMLMVVSAVGHRDWRSGLRARWPAATLLFLYAAPFSFAYVTLGVGTGALILFGTVQLTMIAAALRAGEQPRPVVWLGLALALSGLVVLVRPGLTAPPVLGALLMTVAGVAWAFYTLRGQASADPISVTTANFVLAVPLALGLGLVAAGSRHVTPYGAALALTAGAVTSGLGYVAWYGALNGLTRTRAAAVQLLVPVLAAAVGVTLLGEPVSARLVAASGMILGGVALAVAGRVQRA